MSNITNYQKKVWNDGQHYRTFWIGKQLYAIWDPLLIHRMDNAIGTGIRFRFKTENRWIKSKVSEGFPYLLIKSIEQARST